MIRLSNGWQNLHFALFPHFIFSFIFIDLRQPQVHDLILHSELPHDAYQLPYLLIVARCLHEVIDFLDLALKVPGRFQVFQLVFILLVGVAKEVLLPLHGPLEALEGRVRVILYLLIVHIDVHQAEVLLITVRALNGVVLVPLSLLGLPPYAEAANVIITTVRN